MPPFDHNIINTAVHSVNKLDYYMNAKILVINGTERATGVIFTEASNITLIFPILPNLVLLLSMMFL